MQGALLCRERCDIPIRTETGDNRIGKIAIWVEKNIRTAAKPLQDIILGSPNFKIHLLDRGVRERSV